MYNRPSGCHQTSMFGDLESMLDQKHPLYVLAKLIHWELFEEEFKKHYCQNNGSMAKPIRRMVGLILLKHIRNVSDESVVEQFSENAYYQYFCGEHAFTCKPPCVPTELVQFRKRIGEAGVELILKESIRVNMELEDRKKERERKSNGKSNRGRKPEEELTAFIDTTVQEKNVTFPTDSKLLNKVIGYCHNIAQEEDIKLHQTFAKEIKQLKLVQRFRGRSHSAKKVKKADKRMRTIAGILLREILRNLPEESPYKELLDTCMKFVNGEKYDGHKIYSLHEPDVLCIGKGKDHVKYEFGNKVSITRLWNGTIIGAMSFRNEYDGHTIDRAMEQVERIFGRPLKSLAGDRGYRGQKTCGGTNIEIPSVPKSSDTAYARQKKHNLFCKRAGIEPVIGHCKSDHRLSRNFYKGLFGDSINVMLSAAAFNFKRVMNLLLCPVLNVLNMVFVWLGVLVRILKTASEPYQSWNLPNAMTF